MRWLVTDAWQRRRSRVILERELRAKRPPNSRRAFFVNVCGRSAATFGVPGRRADRGRSGSVSQCRRITPSGSSRSGKPTGSGTRPSAPRTSSPASPSSTSSTCSPTPAAPGCTSAIPRATPPPTSSAATSGCAASTSCTRWAGTPSACPPSSTPIKTNTHPADHDPDEHRHLPPPDQVARLLLRLGPRDRHDRPRLLPLDPVDLPPALRHLVRPRPQLDRRPGPPARTGKGRPIAELPIPAGHARPRRLPRLETARLPRRGPGQLVPRAGDGAGQRGGHRRQERARRPSRRPDAAAAVDAPHHRLRRSARRRPRARRLVPRHQGHAAQLDRPERRGRGRFLHRRTSPSAWLEERHQAGFPETPAADVIRVFTTRPDTLFGATYMVLAPEHPLVERLTTPEQRDAVAAYRAQAAPQERPRPHRPGQDQDRRLHRRPRRSTRSTASRSRSGSPTTS